MKKAIAYTCAAVLCLCALTGCGRMENDAGKTSPSPSPVATSTPASATPDVSDGIVNDNDGIITSDDNGAVAEPSAVPETTAGAETTPALPSPSSSPKTGNRNG